MTNKQYLEKFSGNDPRALANFVQFGFVIYKDLYDPHLISAIHQFITSKFDRLVTLHKQGQIPRNVHEWAIAIIDKLETSELSQDYANAKQVIEMLKRYLGPDIAMLGKDALWINVPSDTHPVLEKPHHTDAWTGTSVQSLFFKTFFTDVDDYNGLSVVPQSHSYGMTPVRNRTIDPLSNIEIDSIDLNNIKAGDSVLWHPLLIHSTTGRSDKNMRISITSRFTSTESPFSSQERSLGYRTLSVGPLNQILRLIGNDYLTPLRTYGGVVALDRRLAKLYGLHHDNTDDIDYGELLKSG